MSNYDPQTLENLAWSVPRPSKIDVLEVPGSLNSRKRRPRPAKRCPRSTEEGPRVAQECPKAGQVAPKSWPRRPQTLPKPSAVTSKTSFQHNLCWQLCAKGSWSDFVSFFCSCDKLAICKKLRKTWGKLWFLHITSFFALEARTRKKNSKNEALGLPKPFPDSPETLQNRPRSGPRSRKTSPERQKTQQDAPNAPKRPQERKIVPTWLQHSQQNFRSVACAGLP